MASRAKNRATQSEPIDANVVPRTAQALRLRRLGYTYDAIAQECGWPHASNARKAIKRAEASIIRDDARSLVGWQLDMLDAALQVVMTHIVANDPYSLDAVDRLVPLLRRQADLMGLDAPKDAAPRVGNIQIVVPGADAI